MTAMTATRAKNRLVATIARRRVALFAGGAGRGA
jgi:hypothetical protein